MPEVSQPRSEKTTSSAPPAATPAPTQPSPGPYTPPTSQFANATLNEKSSLHNQFSTPPPPAYQQGPPVLSVASALYAYTPTDAGDLALQPNDRIQVLEHMNNDCTAVCHFVIATRLLLTQYGQGGVVEMSEPTWKVSSLAATYELSRRNPFLLRPFLSRRIMAICLWKSVRVVPHPKPKGNIAGSENRGRSLGRSWAMLVSSLMNSPC